MSGPGCGREAKTPDPDIFYYIPRVEFYYKALQQGIISPADVPSITAVENKNLF